MVISKLKSLKVRFYNNIRNNLINTRSFLFNLKEKFPYIGRPLVFLYRFLYSFKFIIERKILLLQARLRYGKLYFNKNYWINPKKIQFFYRKDMKIWQKYFRIIEGDWDELENRFDDISYYQAFKHRFKEGKKWEDTIYYQEYQNSIIKGKIRRGAKNKEELDALLRIYELLYSSIKKNGFKPKKELTYYKGFFKKLNIHDILDDIAVHIGRDGDILVHDGRHRLSIAKILDLPKVPIIIVARHKKWMDFRKYLFSFSKKNQVGPLNQILTHPDLQNIPFKKDNHFDLIIKNISVLHGKVFDIGAKFGYFCHILEDKGFDCYAIEENRDYAFFLKKLKILEEKKFKIITKSIFEFNKNQDLFFDVVLALNRFHGFLKTRESYLNLINFLKRLKVKELFFGTYDLSKFRNRNFYRNYSSEQFVNFIIENSCLNKAEFIGKTKDSRKLYKFTSEK